MKSEVFKTFKCGFVLSEQDIRRVWNCCEQHFSKLNPQNPHIVLEANLKDASVVSTKSIDEILSLENGGAKQITKVNLNIRDAEKDAKHSIEVTFRNGYRDATSWISMALLVQGEDRDWVFLAADEIEDRLKRLRRLGVEYLAAHRLILPILMGVCVLLAFSFLIIFTGSAVRDALAQIEEKVSAGQELNPVSVLLQIEQAKQARNLWGILPVLLCTVAVPLVLVYLISELLPRLLCSYHFCWGEYTSVYERRRSRAKIFWISGVLAVLISIIAGLIVKNFYP